MPAFDAVRSLPNELPPSPLLAPEHDASRFVAPLAQRPAPDVTAFAARRLPLFSADERRDFLQVAARELPAPQLLALSAGLKTGPRLQEFMAQVQAHTPPATRAAFAQLFREAHTPPAPTKAEQRAAFARDGRQTAAPVMAAFHAQYGQGPQQWHGRDDAAREVAKALRLPADADPQLASNIADRLVHFGGEHPKVTPLPVLVDVPGAQGGLVLTGVFKVERPEGGTRIVDARALDYADFADFQHNNTLPRVDAKMVTPRNFDYARADGRLDLYEGAARIEGPGERLVRETAVPVGVAAGLAGVVIGASSWGTLAAPGAVLAAEGLAMIAAHGVVTAASAYGAAVSVASVSSQAAHGANLNPLQNPGIALEYANGALAAANLGTLGYMAGTGKDIARGLSAALGLGGLGMTGVDGVTLALDWERMEPEERHERLLMTGLNVGGMALHGVAALKGSPVRPRLGQEIELVPPGAAEARTSDTLHEAPWFSLRPPAAEVAAPQDGQPMFRLGAWNTPDIDVAVDPLASRHPGAADSSSTASLEAGGGTAASRTKPSRLMASADDDPPDGPTSLDGVGTLHRLPKETRERFMGELSRELGLESVDVTQALLKLQGFDLESCETCAHLSGLPIQTGESEDRVHLLGRITRGVRGEEALLGQAMLDNRARFGDSSNGKLLGLDLEALKAATREFPGLRGATSLEELTGLLDAASYLDIPLDGSLLSHERLHTEFHHTEFVFARFMDALQAELGTRSREQTHRLLSGAGLDVDDPLARVTMLRKVLGGAETTKALVDQVARETHTRIAGIAPESRSLALTGWHSPYLELMSHAAGKKLQLRLEDLPGLSPDKVRSVAAALGAESPEQLLQIVEAQEALSHYAADESMSVPSRRMAALRHAELARPGLDVFVREAGKALNIESPVEVRALLRRGGMNLDGDIHDVSAALTLVLFGPEEIAMRARAIAKIAEEQAALDAARRPSVPAGSEPAFEQLSIAARQRLQHFTTSLMVSSPPKVLELLRRAGFKLHGDRGALTGFTQAGHVPNFPALREEVTAKVLKLVFSRDDARPLAEVMADAGMEPKRVDARAVLTPGHFDGTRVRPPHSPAVQRMAATLTQQAARRLREVPRPTDAPALRAALPGLQREAADFEQAELTRLAKKHRDLIDAIEQWLPGHTTFD